MNIIRQLERAVGGGRSLGSATIVVVWVQRLAIPPRTIRRPLVALSGFARGVGMASLLLVPIGLVWLLYEWHRKNDGKHGGRAVFVVASLTTVSLAVLVGGLRRVKSYRGKLYVMLREGCFL